MSTRSAVIIAQQYTTLHLYRHMDGYLAEAGAAIVEAIRDSKTPQMVTSKLLGMHYNEEQPIYEHTADAYNHGDLEHLYEIVQDSKGGWMITHSYRATRDWTEHGSDPRNWHRDTYCELASFAMAVNIDRRLANARLLHLKITNPGEYLDIADYKMVVA